MAILIDKQEVYDAIDRVDEIKGFAYIRILEEIGSLPIHKVEKDCRGCFGASFGDCDSCENYKYVSLHNEIQKRLVAPIEWFDNVFERYCEVLDEWVQYFNSERRKHARKVKTLWQRIKRVK